MAILTHWDGEPVSVWARVWRAPLVEAHDSLGSTNDRLKELAAQGSVRPFSVVVAEEQTAGRGRKGDVWHSPAGSGLWISVLLPGAGHVPQHLPLLVGLAAARAAEAGHPGVQVGIKWPNDLEIDGRKVAGILCERSHGHVVAGVGINVRLPAEGLPEAVAARATSLELASRAPVSLAAVATRLLHDIHELVGVRGDGVLTEALHAELAARDTLRDRPVWTQQAGEGVARGIDTDGAMWLERSDGQRVRIVSGSVRTS